MVPGVAGLVHTMRLLPERSQLGVSAGGQRSSINGCRPEGSCTVGGRDHAEPRP
jgi:hypothetical protein